jgi:uncharacterized protein DUF5335
MERHIPKGEWRAFFDRFCRERDRWLITLDCDRTGSAFRDLPLRGIAIDDTAIEIFVHGSDGAHIAHVVRRPADVIGDETSEGGDIDVTILNTEGKRTVVQFRTAVPALIVNGRLT